MHLCNFIRGLFLPRLAGWPWTPVMFELDKSTHWVVTVALSSNSSSPWQSFGSTPLCKQADSSIDGWWLVILLFAICLAKNAGRSLIGNMANKSITSPTVSQEQRTRVGLSWLTPSSTSSHSATQSNKWSPRVLLWLITSLQLKSISHSHHVDKEKNLVIRNGFALSGLKTYKLQSDYADKIPELNLPAVTTLVTVLSDASFKNWIYLCATARGQSKKGAGTAPAKTIYNSFKWFPSTVEINN